MTSNELKDSSMGTVAIRNERTGFALGSVVWLATDRMQVRVDGPVPADAMYEAKLGLSGLNEPIYLEVRVVASRADEGMTVANCLITSIAPDARVVLENWVADLSQAGTSAVPDAWVDELSDVRHRRGRRSIGESLRRSLAGRP